MAFDLNTFPIPPLPTLDRLNAVVPEALDERRIVTDWLNALSNALESNKFSGLSSLFLEDSWWRDMLALTWDFRTFRGIPVITQFLQDQIPYTHPRTLKLREEYLGLQRPADDLAWISTFFDFETDVGIASGIVRLVPTANGDWKAHVVYTNLEDLKGFPEKLGPLRNPLPNHGSWARERKREAEFIDADPAVLIIGGGQSGLDVAARLKCLDVRSLIVEKNERVGDNWRNRYEALCLHDPVWFDHMPYLPFPPNWPAYSPARKSYFYEKRIANWLEIYAEAMELNIWTSSTVTKALQDPVRKVWKVTIKRSDGSERVMTVRHIVFATGISSPEPKIPKIPGMDKFRGQLLHSLQHKKATDHVGKKVVIVGAGTSAHDIAHDYHNHGVDVTMFQRGSTYIMSTKNGWDVLFRGLYCEGGPPVDIADRVAASYPRLMSMEMAQRNVQKIAKLDKGILDGLTKRGFRINFGIQGTGSGLLAWSRAGGYYLDVGASQLIADGKIKLKNDSQIKEFTETGILFGDGSELPADVVVFATGLGDLKEQIRQVCGDEVTNACNRIWGLNEEGELNGAWREVGVPGLWYMLGNLALCRFHSKHIALQIKAIEEGVFGERYTFEGVRGTD
ncbi:hypothetical protein AMATHDRAFT_151910 [Amanita thiersii Skay4041]|uniref:FAD/NAD(P)-binding domain-containing protein n=1 Tax=Amanita thiersii Skay4041 TaxID=703135 RepID=A0A2A9NA54_9AGAR|nr:hypothetical protein AMATHDRAFT_151910 [Amanita thiersii Skay4041]